MAGKNESTMKWKVDIANLTKSMQEAKRQISLANAEFKNATAGMDKWQDSATGLESKLSQLKKTYDAQEKTLELLNKKYEITKKELGETSPEAQKLKIQIENQEAAVKKTAAEMATYNTKLETVKKDAEKSESALGQLTKTIDAQEKELTELTDDYKNAVIQYGKNSDEAKELAGEIDKLSGELKDNKDALKEADDAAEGLTEGLNDAGGEAGDTESYTVMKGVLADLAATAIKAVVDGLKDMAKYAKEAWSEFDSGRDTLIKLTGATGENAEAITETYKKVAKSVNAELDDVGKAVGEVNTRFGLTGDDLEDLSTLFLKFADINGTDVLGSVDDVQKAMNAYGLDASQAAAFLDRLTATAQGTGVSTSKLTSGLVSNATAFQEMGLSVDQAVALMGQLEKSGANSETVLNGMRKALKNSAADGKDMSTVLSELQNTITNASDSTEGLNAAYDVFGKSGDQIYGVIKNGTLNFNELAGTAEDVTGTVENTFTETQSAADDMALTLQSLKVDTGEAIDKFLKKYSPQIKKAIENIGKALDKVIPAAEDFIDYIIKNGDTISAIIGGIVAAIAAMKLAGIIMGIVSAFTALFAAVSAGIPIMTALNVVLNANPIGIIIGLIAGLVAAFVILWNKSEAFRDFFIGMWDAIKEVVGGYIDAIIGFFTGAWDAIKEAWESATDFFAEVFAGIKSAFDGVVEWFSGIFEDAWNAVKGVFDAVGSFFSDVWEDIKEAFDAVEEWFKGIFEGAWNAVTGVFSGAKQFFKDVWKDIKGVFKNVGTWFEGVFQDAYDAVETIFSGLAEVIKAPINLIIDGINTFIKGLNKIQIPDWVPGVGGKGLSFDTIPNLAKGGILKKGQVGFLEGDGAEAVVPLEKNTGWIANIAKMLEESLEFKKLSVSLEGISDSLKADISGAGYLMHGNTTGGGSGKVQNMTFNQTINSPKALDRLSIYRDTNQMLFSAKVRMGNV